MPLGPVSTKAAARDGVALITSNVAQGAQSNLTAAWTYTLELSPDGANAPVTARTQIVRCDHALNGYPRSVGCAVSSVKLVLRYSRTGSYPELAKHIYQAQNSGLPGAPGKTPLTKLNVRADNDANRNRACPSRYPRPSGKSCDE